MRPNSSAAPLEQMGQIVELRRERSYTFARTCGSLTDGTEEESQDALAGDSCPASAHPSPPGSRNEAAAPWRAGEFYTSLAIGAISEFLSLTTTFNCEVGRVLLLEGAPANSVLLLLQGKVVLLKYSSARSPISLGVAMPGDVLGLASALLGCAHDLSAQALCACKIASFPRDCFVDFLVRHPDTAHAVARQWSRDFKQASDMLVGDESRPEYRI